MADLSFLDQYDTDEIEAMLEDELGTSLLVKMYAQYYDEDERQTYYNIVNKLQDDYLFIKGGI